MSKDTLCPSFSQYWGIPETGQTVPFIIIIFFNLRTAAFKAYCAIWVRRSNFRHQASSCVSPRQSTQRRKVELWARNIRHFCLNFDFHVTFRDLLHAVKLRHGTDGFTSPPKEGMLRIFFTLKIRRIRPGANPRTWVPKTSTLHLENRSRSGQFHSQHMFAKQCATTESSCIRRCFAAFFKDK
jgi:hypothetical protein